MGTEEPATPPSEKSPPTGAAPAGLLSRTPVLVGLLAGAILAVVFVVAILRESAPEPAVEPGGARAAPRRAAAPHAPVTDHGIQLVSPIGSVPHGKITLHWKPLEEFEQFEVTVLDNRARLIWKSRPTTETSATVPSRNAEYVVPGATYFWKVTGTRPDGGVVDTSSVAFILSE